MFPTKLSALLLIGLVTTPAIAAAGPKTHSDGSPAAASDRAAARGDTRGERERGATKEKRKDGLCARLECTSEQRAAIRAIRHETRERLTAERRDNRELFEQMKAKRTGGVSRDGIASLKAKIDRERRQHDRIVAGAIERIGAVLDGGQRAKLTRLVKEHGAKVALGGSGNHHGKGKKALRAKRLRGDSDKSEFARGKRVRGDRAGKLAKRDRA